MKKLIFICLSFLTLSSISFAAQGWLENYDEAIANSQQKKLPILADFTGSDWCGWCIKLRNEVFSKQEFKDYAKDNLVLLEVDFPSRKQQTRELKMQNERLSEKYGVRGYPTILILNSKGEVIAQTGYQYGGAKKYVEHLKTLIASSKTQTIKTTHQKKKTDKDKIKVFYTQKDADKIYKKIQEIKTIAVQSKDNKLYWGSMEYNAAINGLKENASELGANAIIILDAESNSNTLKVKAVYCEK